MLKFALSTVIFLLIPLLTLSQISYPRQAVDKHGDTIVIWSKSQNDDIAAEIDYLNQDNIRLYFLSLEQDTLIKSHELQILNTEKDLGLCEMQFAISANEYKKLHKRIICMIELDASRAKWIKRLTALVVVEGLMIILK